MLKTAKKQNVSSTKIYDLLIGLGADKKKAEFAIGEFVKDIPKILASHTTEKNLDPTVPVSRGDIWRLEFVITEIKRDLELKLAEIKRDLELKITENKKFCSPQKSKDSQKQTNHFHSLLVLGD